MIGMCRIKSFLWKPLFNKLMCDIDHLIFWLLLLLLLGLLTMVLVFQMRRKFVYICHKYPRKKTDILWW